MQSVYFLIYKLQLVVDDSFPLVEGRRLLPGWHFNPGCENIRERRVQGDHDGCSACSKQAGTGTVEVRERRRERPLCQKIEKLLQTEILERLLFYHFNMH